MKFKKFVVLATLVLVVYSQMALGTRGQTELQFPVLPYSGNQTIYSPCSPVNDEQYYIKYAGFGYSCIEKSSGFEIPASMISTKIVDFNLNKMAIIKNFGILSTLSRIIQIDENRFCVTKRKGNIKEELFMFDCDGMKWKTNFDDAGYSAALICLNPNRILYGSRILDAETGNVLLEVDKKYNSLTRNIIKKGSVIVVDRSAVIDINKPTILWSIPGEHNITGFYENMLIVINEKFIVTYYDPLSGKVLNSFEFKPRIEPSARIGELSGIAGKSVYTEAGFVIDIESGIVLVQKRFDSIRNVPKRIKGHFVCGDEKYLIWEDVANTECLDAKTGKILWRKETSSYIYYQEFEGRLYKNTLHLANNIDAKNNYVESLSILEGDLWKELARMPFGGFSYLSSASLIPTRHGILWLPHFQHESEGPSIIVPGTSLIQRAYPIKEWGEGSLEDSAGYALNGDMLVVNLDGLGIYLIDLESGKTEFIKITYATKSENANFGPVPLSISKRYAVTYDINGKIVCFDIVKKTFLRKIGPTKDNIDLRLDDVINQFFLGEWFSVGRYIINLETGEIIETRDSIVGVTDKGYLTEDDGISLLVPGEKPKNLISHMRFYDAGIPIGSPWKTLANYGISGNAIIDIDKKIIIQKMLQYHYGNLSKISFSNDEIIFADLGKTLRFSPCPSFSVKRTGRGGGDSKDGGGEVSFEFKNTREDERDLVLKGEAYLVSWGDDGKAPVFAKLNEPRHKLGPLLPGMSQEITFKLPEPPLMEHNQKGEGKYFALVVESNGLMDREKSVLSEYDKDPRPLFDGTPVALDQQKAIVVTVWGR